MHISRTRPAAGRREGFALAVALFALVVIGALIAGAFFASTQEYRVGRNSLVQQRAVAAAEYGLATAVKDWSSNGYASMTKGQTSAPRTIDLGNQTSAVVRVTRLNDLTWWATSEGAAGPTAASARRRTNAVLRLKYPSMNILGAMTVNGSVSVSGTAEVHGEDTGTWTDCPPTSGGLPGVVVPPGETVTTRGSSDITAPPGASDWTTNTAAGDEARYFDYGGGLTWDELVARADARLTGGTLHPYPADTLVPPTPGGTPVLTCNVWRSLNWGDPLHATPASRCTNYYPIIYVNGNLRINSHGIGQGILLVNGNLDISGGFEFYGPVIVRGDFGTTGSGGHIFGALMASRVTLESTVAMAGSAEVTYSSCAVNRALTGSATPGIAAQRGWADLY